MAKTRRTQGAGRAETLATPGPSGPEGEWVATQILPAGRDFLPKGPRPKRRFGSFAAVSKGTRRRGGGTLLREPEQLEKERTPGASSRGGPFIFGLGKTQKCLCSVDTIGPLL